MFLDHVIDQIQEIKCYTTIVEDRIERAHQRRHKISFWGATNQNRIGKMNIEAKDDPIGYNKSIADVKKALRKNEN